MIRFVACIPAPTLPQASESYNEGLGAAGTGEESVAAAGGGSAGARKGPTAVILEPARDLAEQTFDCVNAFRTNLVRWKI